MQYSVFLGKRAGRTRVSSGFYDILAKSREINRSPASPVFSVRARFRRNSCMFGELYEISAFRGVRAAVSTGPHPCHVDSLHGFREINVISRKIESAPDIPVGGARRVFGESSERSGTSSTFRILRRKGVVSTTDRMDTSNLAACFVKNQALAEYRKTARDPISAARPWCKGAFSAISLKGRRILRHFGLFGQMGASIARPSSVPLQDFRKSLPNPGASNRPHPSHS